MPVLQSTTKSFHVVRYIDLEDFIEEATGKRLDILSSEEWYNGSEHSLEVRRNDVSAGMLDAYLEGKMKTMCLEDILCALCYEHLLPPGNYLVRVSC